MLHLRVISPKERSGEVLDILDAEPGAVGVTLSRGDAVDPPGDVIEADLARACVNSVLAALTALDVVRAGSISFAPTGTLLSQAGDRADDAVGRRADRTVVWEQLLGQAREWARYTPTFLAFLVIAILLSAVGVTTASPMTLVGAMVVGPEFRPLAALSVGLVRRDSRIVRASIRTLAISFPAAMLITVLATMVWVRLGWIGVGDVENARAFDFIYHVGPFSLVVALLAGVAGMLAVVNSSSAVLVGVFISVTTVPAAGLAAVAAYAGKWHAALSSLAQLGVNLIGIVLAGVAVLLLLQRDDRRSGRATVAAPPAHGGDNP
ncbi:DUF389 domain-containing protein [Nocardia concava]|uniref:DUF389 domain-containing protein n=1 Tax=Nocardia concava TaxID=257281 RepID=UPI000304E65E